MTLSPTFIRPSTPFYLGGGVTASSSPEHGDFADWMPDTVTLDGYTFPVDLTQWRSGPQDTFRDTIVGGGQQPDDTLFSAKGAWARYKYSWHHGAGQGLADLDPDADLYRWDSSAGMQWWTKYQLTLVHSTTLNRSVASSSPVLCRSDIYVFLSDGVTLYRTTDLITWTAMTAPGGTVQAMTSDGTDLYVATTTGVVKYVGAGTVPTAFATPVAVGTDAIAFMAGRLLAGQANVLVEIAAVGTLTTIKTHFQAAFRWTTLFNIGSRLYVGGFAGSRSELHSLTTDSSGNLVQAQEAAPLPLGEKLRAGISFAGESMLCTSNGVRIAQVSGDGALTYGPLITEPGDVRCAAADGRYLFAGWSLMPSSRSGLLRLVADDEVAPLQPSYGASVFEGAVQANVTGVARLNNQTVFAVAGSGAWVESTTAFATQASIDSGRITFGTVEPKGLLDVHVEYAPLGSNESVEIDVYDENAVLIGHGAAVAGSESMTVDLNGEQVTSLRVKLTVIGASASSPIIYRWRVRAYPIPPPVLQWVLPLVVKDAVVVDGNEGIEHTFDVEERNVWIEELWSTRRLVTLRIGTRTYRVRCDTFEWRPDAWDGDGAGPQGLLVVQLVAA